MKIRGEKGELQLMVDTMAVLYTGKVQRELRIVAALVKQTGHSRLKKAIAAVNKEDRKYKRILMRDGLRRPKTK